MWGVLKDIDSGNKIIVEPPDAEFYEYFKDFSSASDLDYFNDNYKHEDRLFLKEYDNHR